MGAPILGTTLRAACRVAIASLAVFALLGCTFGDESLPEAKPGAGPWFSDNCFPAECMFECCYGWNYSQHPLLQGGKSYGPECDKLKNKNSEYADYIALMLQDWNNCSEELRDWESGTCYAVQPPDVIKEFTESGQPVYSGLNFAVCPPRGQIAAQPIKDVAFIPKE